MGERYEHKCWLVTGGSGQLGLALQRNAPSGVRILAPTRTEFDMATFGDVRPLLERERISLMINSGAYTAVDRAETEPQVAHLVNAVAPARLAAAAKARGIPIIQISTDYVFSGENSQAWVEQDPTGPTSVYGRTKAEGEEAVRASGAQHAIIRTAWVVSADGQNFIKTMLRLGQQQEAVRVVSDQVGTPTHAGDLSKAVIKVADAFSARADRASGTWHCTNSGETTWFGLAIHIFEAASRAGMKVPTRVEAITTADYPTAAKRPGNSRLDTRAIEREFGVKMRPWQHAVNEIVEQLARKAVQI